MTSNNQKGQASVFVLALIGVVLVSVVFLFESGRLTSEKMQLQNAADAAAFGASTLEARSLNFAAYTNRAMVANEVAIGQMVGILSFIDELKTSGEYLDAYGDALILIGIPLDEIVVGEILQGVGEVLKDVGEGITEVGQEIEEFINPIASVVVRGLSIINTVYSVSQTVYHGATILLETTTIFQTLEDNVPGTTPFNLLNIFDPDKPGAHLSDLGVISLVGHLPSYWSGYTKRYTPSKKDKDKGDDNKEAKKEMSLVEKEVNVDKKHLKKAQDQYQKDLKKLVTEKEKLKEQAEKCKELIDNKPSKPSRPSRPSHPSKKELQHYKNKLEHYESKYKEFKRYEKKIKKCVAVKDNIISDIAKLKTDIKKDKKAIGNDQAKLTKDQKKLAEEQKEIADETKDKEEKKEEGGEENEGMQRLAATIREARDPFTSGGDPVYDKGWFGKQKYYNRDWFFGLGFDYEKKIFILGKFGIEFKVGFDSKGGSEIRYKGDSYTWSAVDTAVFEALLEIELFSKKLIIDPALPLGGGAYQATGKSSDDEDEGGGDEGGGEEDESEGEGGLGNTLTVADMPPTLGYYGDPKAYGGAGYPYGRWISWEGAALELEENVMEGNPYRGLQPYRDMNDEEKKKSKFSIDWPWTSPFFLVGVVRKMDDITKTSTNYDTDEAPHFSGNLNLIDDDHNKIIDRIGTIAKSELYFNRPTDKSYFLRLDKKTEEPNVFSPFWQARLVKTSDIDRLIALAIQHKIIWLSKTDAEAIPGLETIKEDLEKVLNLF